VQHSTKFTPAQDLSEGRPKNISKFKESCPTPFKKVYGQEIDFQRCIALTKILM